jgi:DNA-binding MarR family transcriptional regulator
VTLTPRGEEVARDFADGHRALARRIFADLPAQQLETFDTVLRHVIARVRETSEHL